MLDKSELFANLKQTQLPIVELIDSIHQSLQNASNLILQAEPGAGKTTIVPLSLLSLLPAGKKILVLEPRRLAARNAAYRMADLCGQSVGQTVGYRIRNQNKISKSTQIEVVTEGILTRMIQQDPELEEIAIIIFDEFHERSIHADLGLALCLEVQQTLREDLKLLVMSATLDIKGLSQLLDEPPVIHSRGRSFEVAVDYMPIKKHFDWLSQIPQAVNQLIKSIDLNKGQSLAKDILVFLPGVAEIKRAQTLLLNSDLVEKEIMILPLYGDMPIDQQQQVLFPLERKIKIILATNIAETSLTIEGIGFVIDSGLQRQSYFDPNVGFNRLQTVRISQASATQRAGRAGRLSAGKCLRLWSESETLRAQALSEIQRSDLANLLLELAKWGTTDIDATLLIEKPNQGAINQARELLQSLRCIDDNYKITQQGIDVLNLGVHPRIGHMLIQSIELGTVQLACLIAAILEEKDVFTAERKKDVDFNRRVQYVIENDNKTTKRIKQQATRLEQRLSKFSKASNKKNNKESLTSDIDKCGLLLACAFPERIAMARGQGYLLANGSGAGLRQDGFIDCSLMVIVELGGKGSVAQIFQASPLSKAEFDSLCEKDIEEKEEVSWDVKEQRVKAQTFRQYMQLKFDQKALPNPKQELVQRALVEGIYQQGIKCLPWSDENKQWLSRVNLLAELAEYQEVFPLLNEQFLLDNLTQWLQPFLDDCKSLKDITSKMLTQALTSTLDWSGQQQLEVLAPTRYQAPSGSEIRIDYCQGSKPVLAVKLQEMFGEIDTPRIANGKIPLLVHLLSPARRPLQITEDLVHFWQNSYQAVKKDMKGRYPKHPWPDDPLTAQATRLTKKALNKQAK